MKTITYRFADGTESNVIVSEEFHSLYSNMEKTDKLLERRQTRRTQSLERSFDNGWDIEDPDVDVASEYERRESIRKLYAAISVLSPMQKELLYMVFFERIPQKEIALQEGVSKVAISMRITRILRKLKKFME